jgi:N-acetyltransferase 10
LHPALLNHLPPPPPTHPPTHPTPPPPTHPHPLNNSTEAHARVVPRFNERLVLSLAACRAALLMDDELNVLPTSAHVRALAPAPGGPAGAALPGNAAAGGAAASADPELASLAEGLRDVQPAGALVSRCRTLDQARAVVSFLDAASERGLRSTVALTAARGRGKSAALGLAIAGALALGYSNVFVTAPSPENLRTLFEFACKGLEELGYQEHIGESFLCFVYYILLFIYSFFTYSFCILWRCCSNPAPIIS